MAFARAQYIRSPEGLARAVQMGVTRESLVLDFKESVHGWAAPDTKVRREAQKETCRDIARFANTWGGCLLIGVGEGADPSTRLRVAGPLAPLDRPEQLKEWIEHAITNFLVPATLTHDVTPVQVAGGAVVAVNVEPSRHAVFLWDREEKTIQCLRRTSHGKVYMNPDEMERHMMNGSRATRLALESARARARNEVDLAGGFHGYSGGDKPPPLPLKGPVQVGAVGEDSLELRVPYGGTVWSVAVPYEVVLAAWVTTDQKIGLVLSMRIVQGQDGQLRLEGGRQ